MTSAYHLISHVQFLSLSIFYSRLHTSFVPANQISFARIFYTVNCTLTLKRTQGSSFAVLSKQFYYRYYFQINNFRVLSKQFYYLHYFQTNNFSVLSWYAILLSTVYLDQKIDNASLRPCFSIILLNSFAMLNQHAVPLYNISRQTTLLCSINTLFLYQYIQTNSFACSLNT